jgi:hypothetical protein
MRRVLNRCRAWLAGEKRFLSVFGPLWVLLVAFQVWTVLSGGQTIIGESSSQHYDELARAFQLHQLALPVPVDPVLLHAPNPYDEDYIDGHFIWDLSYYKGHYYLYFGATPCVLLFYPWLMVTGQDLNECLGYLIISSVNLLLFGLILRAFSRRLFPNCPLVWPAALFFVYGIASPLTYLLRLVDMYEIATASGGTCILFSAYFLFLGLYTPRWRPLYFALVSLGWGAAVGSRPPLLFAGTFLFFAWLNLAHEQAGLRAAGWGRFLANTLALALPAAIVLGLIGWYNDARFDSPFEFGQRFETNIGGTGSGPMFSIYYFPDRFMQYFLLPPCFCDRFPFINPSSYPLSWLYSEQVTWEHFTGVLVSFPILIVGLLWIRHVRRYQEAAGGRLLRVYGMCLTAATVGPLLVLLNLDAGTYRYYCDFLPTFYVLTAFSLMARRHLAPFARWQVALLIVFFLLTAYAGFAYSLIGDNNWIWSLYPAPHGRPLPLD